MELSEVEAAIDEPRRQSPLIERTGYRLIKVGELALATAERALEPLGIKPRQLNVLATLAADATLSQQDVSQRLGIDPNVLVGVIDDLERRGLAERRRNPRDRRRHVIIVTPAGHRLLAEGAARLDAAEAEFFAGVSDADQAVVRRVTAYLIDKHPPVIKR